ASTTGSYEIKVNTTYYGKYAEANDTLVVGAPPTASLGTNPVPYYYDSDGSIIFDLKCSDDVGVDTLQLWGNWSGWHANQTNSTPQNNTWWNVTVNGIPEGIWKWGAWCNDTSGQEDWSDVNRTFTVDTQPPIISGETREPDPTYHSDNATLNATISDPNLEGVWISGNWSGSWVNYTGGITNVSSDYSYKLLSGNLSYQEVVGWRYYANDTSGNVGQGSLQAFTVQNHPPPNVTLEEPPNGTITADNTTFFDWSNVTDDDGDSINYTLQVDNDTDFLSLEIEKTELTNSDYTLTDPEALEDDVYYWRVYSNDSYETNLSYTWQFEINPAQAVAVSMSQKL
ncbi:MAG: hypothetical protein KAU24_00785, partial [Candidatus Aenigmarchaeota archaeon]|nr:hypothetical protein [Candidatus Aenigmarchaeota archaeon]